MKTTNVSLQVIMDYLLDIVRMPKFIEISQNVAQKTEMNY